ncbi:unnamed protein product [Absidia cylindrospora]
MYSTKTNCRTWMKRNYMFLKLIILLSMPPHVVVAVVGPPGSGKTTLIRSLVKRYTKHNLHEIKGPITVVSGKKRLKHRFWTAIIHATLSQYENDKTWQDLSLSRIQ